MKKEIARGAAPEHPPPSPTRRRRPRARGPRAGLLYGLETGPEGACPYSPSPAVLLFLPLYAGRQQRR